MVRIEKNRVGKEPPKEPKSGEGMRPAAADHKHNADRLLRATEMLETGFNADRLEATPLQVFRERCLKDWLTENKTLAQTAKNRKCRTESRDEADKLQVRQLNRIRLSERLKGIVHSAVGSHTPSGKALETVVEQCGLARTG